MVEGCFGESLSLAVEEQGRKADSVAEKKMSSALEAEVVQEAEEFGL